MQKIAIVTGMTGQDGSYLTEYLLENNYKVFAGIRKISYPLIHNPNIKDILNHPNLTIASMDFLDSGSIRSFVSYVKEATISYMHTLGNKVEVYNLAAQSHVGESFKIPSLTHEINAVGVITLLQVLKETFRGNFKFYQASTSELYGNAATASETTLSEASEFKPTSPYAIAKHSAFQTVKHYREVHGIHAVNGILFNHESPRRGSNFVTSKVVKGACAIKMGQQKELRMGNLDASRDWGHAKDYVEAMWMILQHHSPDDFVCSTGTSHTVRDLCEYTFKVGSKSSPKSHGYASGTINFK